MNRLEPCRICGGEAMLLSAPCKRGISPYIWCVRCRSGCFSTPIYISDHDAEEAWNNIMTGESEVRKKRSLKEQTTIIPAERSEDED